MDSDDEFMSNQSSQDFENDLDSEDDLGMSLSDHTPVTMLLIRRLRLDFDDDEQDIGFSQDKDLIKPSKLPYEIDFQVLGPEQIQEQQDEQTNEVAAILSQPPEATAILLRYMRWNKERLIDTYMEKPEELLETAGLGQDASDIPSTTKVKGFTCDICCEDDDELQTYALKCGHRYCVDCYVQYLTSKIKDEGEAALIQCPTSGCNRIIDSKTLEFLVTAKLKTR